MRELIAALGAGRGRFGFRLNHFAVMNDHIHLIVEVESRRSLTRGLKGLAVRLARASNRVWRRTGRVFLERYHEHVLRTPREVRNALVYVLNNGRKHGAWLVPGVADPCSSALWFDGWCGRRDRLPTSDAWAPVAHARTWLQRVGWRRHGLLRIDEVPGGFR